MRLLYVADDTENHEALNISLCEFIGDEIPSYIILSHRWREEEVLFTDMISSDRSIARNKKGYDKLEAACRLTLELGFNYLWVDTCCIDKSSSAELSEVINSMFEYYGQSVICIAYLDDVEDDLEEEFYFQGSCWFSRGWTLQELIAPKELHFYSKGWKKLGTKSSTRKQLSAATGIIEEVLMNPAYLDRVGIFEKMSWAAYRETTRAEDESYSLMGIFGVNMPPLYGEGRQRAFRRLQIEIMRHSHDHTIFSWNSRRETGKMLARSVRDFISQYCYRRMQLEEYCNKFGLKAQDLEYSVTNVGFRIKLPLAKITVPHRNNIYLAFLACNVVKENSLVAICLQKEEEWGFVRFRRVVLYDRAVFHIARPQDYNINPDFIYISGAPKQDGPLPGSMPLASKLRLRITCPLHREAYTSLATVDANIPSYVEATVCRDTFRHDLVIFPHSIWKRQLICIVCGSINGLIWAYAWNYTLDEKDATPAEELVQKLHQDLTFPSGLAWLSIKTQIKFFEPDPLAISKMGSLNMDSLTQRIRLDENTVIITLARGGELLSFDVL